MALGWKALLCVPVDAGGETNSMQWASAHRSRVSTKCFRDASFMWNVANAVFSTLNPCLLPKVRNLYPTCSAAVCLQSLQVSGGNPIPECSQLTVTEAICWEINSFPTGKTQQVKHEKFSHSHCLIHDGDKTACGHEAEQLAVWCSWNDLGPHATASWKDEGGIQTETALLWLASAPTIPQWELPPSSSSPRIARWRSCTSRCGAEREIWAN